MLELSPLKTQKSTIFLHYNRGQVVFHIYEKNSKTKIAPTMLSNKFFTEKPKPKNSAKILQKINHM